MFERYNEKARRVIFFARYEASRYGSSYIESEHLLLGLIREDKALAIRFLPPHSWAESIRKEIESRITIGKRIPTSVEVPISQECKRILNYAIEEAERLGDKHVSTEHLLLAILREEKCLAAEILQKRGVRLSTSHEWATHGSLRLGADAIREVAATMAEAWNRDDTKALSVLFAEDAEFIDVHGSFWKGRKNIEKALTTIHSSSYRGTKIKSTSTEIRFVRPDVAVVHVAWEFAGDQPEPLPRGVRMILVITEQNGTWGVVAAQTTQISSSPLTK